MVFIASLLILLLMMQIDKQLLALPSGFDVKWHENLDFFSRHSDWRGITYRNWCTTFGTLPDVFAEIKNEDNEVNAIANCADAGAYSVNPDQDGNGRGNAGGND